MHVRRSLQEAAPHGVLSSSLGITSVENQIILKIQVHVTEDVLRGVKEEVRRAAGDVQEGEQGSLGSALN